MDASEILNENKESNEYKEYSESIESLKRERLFAIVSGGLSKQYLGKDLQISDIDTMTSEQINKLYCRYEGRLGASMTKTLGNSLINLYVFGLGKYFNVPDPPRLIQDLEEDPFINNALNTMCCELYYKYGMYLAPFTAMITTAKHISFKELTTLVNNESENAAGGIEKHDPSSRGEKSDNKNE